MEVMTRDEIRTFLLDPPRTGKLATVRADGRPHVAPIWFDLDDDVLIFSTWHTTVKAANLLRDGRVSICVDDDVPPYRFVIMEGTAEVQTEPDADEQLHWSTRIAGRYMGADRAEQFGKRNAVPGEYLIRVTITHTVAQKNISD